MIEEKGNQDDVSDTLHETTAQDVIMNGIGGKDTQKAYLLPKENPLHIPPHVVLSRLDDEVASLRKEIKQLRFRNYEKDKGKKFEGSYTRIFFIMVMCKYIYISHI